VSNALGLPLIRWPPPAGDAAAAAAAAVSPRRAPLATEDEEALARAAEAAGATAFALTAERVSKFGAPSVELVADFPARGGAAEPAGGRAAARTLAPAAATLTLLQIGRHPLVFGALLRRGGGAAAADTDGALAALGAVADALEPLRAAAEAGGGEGDEGGDRSGAA
jgi:hypothetical protein